MPLLKLKEDTRKKTLYVKLLTSPDIVSKYSTEDGFKIFVFEKRVVIKSADATIQFSNIPYQLITHAEKV